MFLISTKNMSGFCFVVGSLPVKGAVYGRGTGPILLDNVICRGTEENLLQCSHRPLYQTDCDHSEDAGVVCQGENSHSICCFNV